MFIHWDALHVCTNEVSAANQEKDFEVGVNCSMKRSTLQQPGKGTMIIRLVLHLQLKHHVLF